MKHTGVQACSKTVARIVSELDGLILGAELRYGKHGPKYFVSDLFPSHAVISICDQPSRKYA